MAKTKRTKALSKKTQSKKKRSKGNSHRIDSSVLLVVLDELNELAGLLRCIPELNILSDSFKRREDEENELDKDRISTTAMEHFQRNIDVIDKEERNKDILTYDARFGIDPPIYACELVGTPEAVIDAVRWRLQRLRAMLEMLRQ